MGRKIICRILLIAKNSTRITTLKYTKTKYYILGMKNYSKRRSKVDISVIMNKRDEKKLKHI